MSATGAAGAGSTDRRALVALCAGAAAVALSPVFVRLSEVGPTATAFWRPAMALPALWLWVFLQPAPRHWPSGRAWLPLVLAGAFFAGDLGFWHASIMRTSVANATLMANVAPLFVVAGARLLFGERVGGWFLVGLVVALCGGALVVGRGGGTAGGDGVLGDVLGLVTAVFFASYLLAIWRVRQRWSVALVMAASGTATAAMLLPVALLSGQALLPRTPGGWTVLLALGLVSHAGGQGLIAYALAHLAATFSSVGLLLEPVMAALFAFLLLREPMMPLQMAGGTLVLAGIALARRR